MDLRSLSDEAWHPLPVSPSTDVGNGGWIFKDDILKEAGLSATSCPDPHPAARRGGIDTRDAELVDLYLTLLRVAGSDVPETATGLDLIGEKTRSASFSALHERMKEDSFMWRTPNHKLILVRERRIDVGNHTAEDVIGGEFHHLKQDPQEWKDLFGTPDATQAVVETMRAVAGVF